MRVLFFGRLGDAAGASEMNAPKRARTLSELRAALCADNPALALALDQAGVRVAVDHVIVHTDADIANAREIAFMSPLSGG
ncbi:hypothetical protein U91I_01404 [alpha proteobacterium U9-1i]|nr:hypothetical protein U91I_01404 [alpha proteobacterium U9-1i]